MTITLSFQYDGENTSSMFISDIIKRGVELQNMVCRYNPSFDISDREKDERSYKVTCPSCMAVIQPILSVIKDTESFIDRSEEPHPFGIEVDPLRPMYAIENGLKNSIGDMYIAEDKKDPYLGGVYQ